MTAEASAVRAPPSGPTARRLTINAHPASITDGRPGHTDGSVTQLPTETHLLVATGQWLLSVSVVPGIGLSDDDLVALATSVALASPDDSSHWFPASAALPR